jgi:hypothetical protein
MIRGLEIRPVQAHVDSDTESEPVLTESAANNPSKIASDLEERIFPKQRYFFNLDPDPVFDCISLYLDCALLSDDADNRQHRVREEEKEEEGVEVVEGVEGRGRLQVLASDGGIIQVGNSALE